MFSRFLIALLMLAAPVMAQSPGNLPLSSTYGGDAGGGGVVPANLCLESGGSDCTFTGVPLLADGTAALPGIGFATEPGTGFRLVSAGVLGLSTAGADRVQFSASAMTSGLAWSGPNGTVGAPAIRFAGDPNTGIRWAGGDQIGMVAGGADRLTIATTQLLAAVPIAPPPSVGGSSPAHTFSGDLDTGMSSTAGIISIGVDGGESTANSYFKMNNNSHIMTWDNGNASQSMTYNNSGGLVLFSASSGFASNASSVFGRTTGVGAIGNRLYGDHNTTTGQVAIIGSTANIGGVDDVSLLQFRHNCGASGATCDAAGGLVIGDVRSKSASGVQYRGTFFTGGVLDFSDTTFNPHRGTAPAALPACTTTTVGLRLKEDTDTAGTAPALCLCSRDNAALTYSWKVLNGSGTC